MAEQIDVAVRIEGYSQFRRDLRAIDRDLDKDLRASLKKAVEREVLPAAKALTPVRTGKLRESLKARASGNRVAVDSRLPYANVQHWGGNVGRGKATHVRGTLFASRAVDARQEKIVDVVGDGIEDLARRHGFH